MCSSSNMSLSHENAPHLKCNKCSTCLFLQKTQPTNKPCSLHNKRSSWLPAWDHQQHLQKGTSMCGKCFISSCQMSSNENCGHQDDVEASLFNLRMKFGLMVSRRSSRRYYHNTDHLNVGVKCSSSNLCRLEELDLVAKPDGLESVPEYKELKFSASSPERIESPPPLASPNCGLLGSRNCSLPLLSLQSPSLLSPPPSPRSTSPSHATCASSTTNYAKYALDINMRRNQKTVQSETAKNKLGTLLTIGTVFLTCAVSIMGFIALGIVSVAAVSWLIFSAIRNLLQHSQKLFYRRSQALQNGSLPCEKNELNKAETIAANTITFEKKNMYKNN